MKKLIKKILKENLSYEIDNKVTALKDAIKRLYPYWWRNNVNTSIIAVRLASMAADRREIVFDTIDKIVGYHDLALEDFGVNDLYWDVKWGDGYDDKDSKPMQNRKLLMIYTKKAHPYIIKLIRSINDPKAIELVR